MPHDACAQSPEVSTLAACACPHKPSSRARTTVATYRKPSRVGLAVVSQDVHLCSALSLLFWKLNGWLARIQAQRWLQQSLEQHGRYITSLIERQNAGNTEPLPPPPQFVYQPPHPPAAAGGAAAACDAAAPPNFAVSSQPMSAAGPSGGQVSQFAFPSSPAAAQQPACGGPAATATAAAAAAGAAAPQGFHLPPGSQDFHAAPGNGAIGAFNAAATEPSDADLLQDPDERHQPPVDGPVASSELQNGKQLGKPGLQAQVDVEAGQACHHQPLNAL